MLALLLALLCVALPPGGGGSPFTDLGFGLAGQSGFTPGLSGEGSLLPGAPVTITMSKMAKSSLAHLVIGDDTQFVPFKGGTLVPTVTRLITGIETRKGLLVIETTWPSGVPSGMTFTMQVWVLDGAGPQGYAASNALQAAVP